LQSLPDGEHHQRIERRSARRRDGAPRRRAPEVEDAGAAARRECCQLGIVGEEHVEPGEHVPAALQRIEHRGAPRLGQPAALGRDADHERIRAVRGSGRDVGHHRDRPTHARALAGGAPGARRVDHRRHLLGR
jgi:hypothetical protein